MKSTIRRHGAFTLVELLVSMAVLSLILVLTLGMTNNVAGLFSRTRSRIDTFQEARAGFESMTRRVSQAMLNTYWDYEYAPSDTKRLGSPGNYARQSELHFISGPIKSGSSPLLPDPSIQGVSHGVFFQAPAGYSAPKQGAPAQSGTLNNLLNATGFYINYGTDLNERPKFLRSAAPQGSSPGIAERFRFRLLEMNQATEYLQVYNPIARQAAPADWFREALIAAHSDLPSTGIPPPTRILSDNIIALVVLPHRSPNDPAPAGRPTELAPNYAYDSRSTGNGELPKLTRNQLPPLVQVTMVAIDENSAARLAANQSTPGAMPDDFGIQDLFAKPSLNENPSQSEAGEQFLVDLAALESRLQEKRVTYRIFTTEVSILQAKWSEN